MGSPELSHGKHVLGQTGEQMLGCGQPLQRHTKSRGGAGLLAVPLWRLWALRTAATVLMVILRRLLFSLLFSSVVLAVLRVGGIVFVATANDRPTEKDCLFLELSFSLKEIKINIERLFFFF